MHPLDYLSPLAHFQKRTDGVEGSCTADVQVGLVEGLEDPDEVRTLLLEKKGDVADQNPKFHEVKYTSGKEIEIHDVTSLCLCRNVTSIIYLWPHKACETKRL